MGRVLDLAIDARGRPHIGFLTGHFDVGTLRYATRAGDEWTVETVETVWGGGPVVLALDEAGRPHLAYGAKELRHAHKQGEQWIVETVTPAAVAYELRALGLVLGQDGQPAIGFYDAWTLKYAHFDGAQWAIEPVLATNGVVARGGLVVDADGKAHLAFCGTLDHPQYVQQTGTGWESQPIGPPAELETCYGADLARDAAGNPHVSYVLASAPTAPAYYGNLMYAVRRTGIWAVETVKTVGNPQLDYNFGTSLVLDGAGMPRIASQDWETQDLYYTYLADCGLLACRYEYLPWIGRAGPGAGG
jgi:hypothetical protein